MKFNQTGISLNQVSIKLLMSICGPTATPACHFDLFVYNILVSLSGLYATGLRLIKEIIRNIIRNEFNFMLTTVGFVNLWLNSHSNLSS